jgi:hypothetical protein
LIPSTLDSQEFQLFLEKSCRIVERAISQTRRNDIFVDYLEGSNSTRGVPRRMRQQQFSGNIEEEEEGLVTLAMKVGDEKIIRGRGVSHIAVSPKFPDLFLASYASPDAMFRASGSNTEGDGNRSRDSTASRSQTHNFGDSSDASDPMGIVCVWSVNNTLNVPEYVFTCESPVLRAEFDPFQPHLIFGGTYSGQVVLWDLRSPKRTPVQSSFLRWDSAVTPLPHTQPVYALNVVGTHHAHNLVTVATDGKLCAWPVDNLAQPLQIMDLVYLPSTTTINSNINTNTNTTSSSSSSTTTTPSTTLTATTSASASNTSTAAPNTGGIMNNNNNNSNNNNNNNNTMENSKGSEEGNNNSNNNNSSSSSSANQGMAASASCMGVVHVNEVNEFFVGTEEGSIFRAHRLSNNSGVKERYKAHYGPVTSLAFHPPKGAIDFSNYFLSSSTDWSVKLWHTKHTKPIYSFEDAADAVFDVQWCPTHPALFAAVDGTGSLQLWNLNEETEMPICKLNLTRGQHALSALRWSTDAKNIFTGDSVGNVHVHQVDSSLTQPSQEEWTLFSDTLTRLSLTQHGSHDE